MSIVPFRGNVDTRLRKLAEGEADATLLAAAGLDRLSRGEIGHAVPIDVMLPAPAQGAVGIEARADDSATLMLLAAIDDLATHICVLAERSLLAALGADCHSPVAALARIDGSRIDISAELLSEDGAHKCADRLSLLSNRPDEAGCARRSAARTGAAGARAAVHRAMKRTLLVLRPEPGASATAAAADAALGFAALAAPLVHRSGRSTGRRPSTRPPARA